MAEFLRQLAPYAAIAPLVTLIVAATAVGVAVWSLFAQKELARGRAAIDFFLKTEMDPGMLEAHKDYRKAIENLKKSCMSDFKSTPDYEHIRTYLDINELMAIAVSKKNLV